MTEDDFFGVSEQGLSYLKNLKLFSIRVKELSEPKFCEEKATGFSSFYKHFLEKPIFGWR